jgi:Kef-type K+ transport system membrane component KefB
MTTLVSLGLVLLGGLVAEKIISHFKIPAVTAYLLCGIILGPSAAKIIKSELLAASDLFSNVALGLISFHIGHSFSLAHIKQIGKEVGIISLVEILISWCCVTATVFLFTSQPLYVSLLYGSISAATAPTAVMIIIRQYRSRGAFTDTLLGIVAIDDAWGIIAFAVSLSAARVLVSDNFSAIMLLEGIGKAGGEIFFSLLAGAFVAYITFKMHTYIKQKLDILTFILGIVIFNVGVASFLPLSPLLVNMFFGTVLINIDKKAFKFFDTLDEVDWPLYIIFYVLSGANLEFSVLNDIGPIGILYFTARIIGKVFGSYVGGTMAESESSIRHYMGLALMPQAGVALGMGIIAKTEFPQVGDMFFSTIVATTVLYEIVGPLATKYALKKAGNIKSHK